MTPQRTTEPQARSRNLIAPVVIALVAVCGVGTIGCLLWNASHGAQSASADELRATSPCAQAKLGAELVRRAQVSQIRAAAALTSADVEDAEAACSNIAAREMLRQQAEALSVGFAVPEAQAHRR